MIPNMDSVSLKAAHDILLAMKPEEASHDAESCALCAMESLEREPEGGPVSDKTYSEEELTAAVQKAVADATAPLKTELDALKDQQGAKATEEAIAAAVAEKEAVIADLQSKFDEAVLKAQGAETTLAETVAYLEAEAAAKAETEAIESRRDERVEAVKAAVAFPEAHYTDEFVNRLAAMADEQFDAQLSDWKALAPKKADDGAEGGIPSDTAFTASRTGGEPTGGASLLSELTNIRLAYNPVTA